MTDIRNEFEHSVLWHAEGGFVDETFVSGTTLGNVISSIRGNAYAAMELGNVEGINYDDIRVESITIEDGVVNYRVVVDP